MKIHLKTKLVLIKSSNNTNVLRIHFQSQLVTDFVAKKKISCTEVTYCEHVYECKLDKYDSLNIIHVIKNCFRKP